MATGNLTDESVPPWKIIFYGTDYSSDVTLKALDANRKSSNEYKVVKSLEVVCKECDSPIRKYATQNNLTIHTWPFDVPPDTYDVGVVVSFGNMIPSSSISACKYGIINAHTSLLPRWRGAAPEFHTILNGDQKSGVTITQVSPNKFDVGNILMQESFMLPEQCTTKILMEELSELAAAMILKTLRKLPEYIKSSYPQPTEGVTQAPKIKPQDSRINWGEDSAVRIDRKFKAFDGYFNVFTTWKGLKIVILSLASLEEVNEARVSSLVKDLVSPGFCYFHKRRNVLFAKCQDGWCGIKTMKAHNGVKITAMEFYSGFMRKEDPEKWYFV